MDLFDTHFHLPEEGDLNNYLDALYSNHSYRMLALGGSLAGSLRALEFARKHDNVWCACGVHPHDAEEFSGDTAPFEEMLLDSKVRAVGEIGLDYFYDLSPRDIQRNTFEKFLTLALQHRKVVCVHCRDQENRFDAYTDCYDMLKDFAAAAGEGKIILHCYAGNPEFQEKFLGLGAYIGVTGMVTFRKAENIREIALHVPDDRLLLETDSPYLAPIPYRGKENHPGFLGLVAACVADLRNRSISELCELTAANGRNFFRIPERSLQKLKKEDFL